MLLSKFRQIKSHVYRLSIYVGSIRRYCNVLDESTTEKNKEKVEEQYVTLNFITVKDGNKHQIKAPIGKDIMRSVIDAGYYKKFNEFGFCGGNRYCTSCHVMFDREMYLTLPEMCDYEKKYVRFMKNSIEGHSRLGCHVDVTKEMDGIVLTIPAREDED